MKTVITPLLVLLSASCLETGGGSGGEVRHVVGPLTSISIPEEGPVEMIAPAATLDGAVSADDRAMTLSIGRGERWGPPARVDADQSEHIGFRLDISPLAASVDMEVLYWDGEEPVRLGLTNWGIGLRVLAALDPSGRRTFWVRARGFIDEGVLTVTRTPFEDGPVCSADCDRLLQLPLPLDSDAQGYAIAESAVYAYLFGRRDLLMAVLGAGVRIAEAGVLPFEVKRLSAWDGRRPPSHRSHKHGMDVDISLYRSTGERVWYPLCADAGRRCLRGTAWEFGGEQMAVLVAGLLESALFDDHVEAGIFIDREYHRAVRGGADRLLERGLITAEVHERFAPRRGVLRHVEPHHHHIHVRVGR